MPTAIGTIRYSDDEGNKKVFKDGEKVTGLSKNTMKELKDAGVLRSEKDDEPLQPEPQPAPAPAPKSEDKK